MKQHSGHQASWWRMDPITCHRDDSNYSCALALLLSLRSCHKAIIALHTYWWGLTKKLGGNSSARNAFSLLILFCILADATDAIFVILAAEIVNRRGFDSRREIARWLRNHIYFDSLASLQIVAPESHASKRCVAWTIVTRLLCLGVDHVLCDPNVLKHFGYRFRLEQFICYDCT